MKPINLETYKRRALFEAFKDREMPCFSTVCMVDISRFKACIDAHGLGFFVPLSFLAAKAVNRVAALRHRIVDGELFEFEQVDPGYTVLLDDETFCFCDSQYFDDFPSYRAHAEACIAQAKANPNCSTGDKHHMFFITALPWFSFTAITHPYSKQYASIPVVSFGKYFADNGGLSLPVGIQVHHGLVDGIHVGRFYQHFADLCENPAAELGVEPTG